MAYTFFATVSRMKYIDRWALMRNSREENLSEHSLEVAMIAHALCTIGNVRYGKLLDADRAAVVGLYHDASEIITGDMPTPVKYYNSTLRDAYKDVERTAEQRLLLKLPEDLREEYVKILSPWVPGDPVKGDPARQAGDVEGNSFRENPGGENIADAEACISVNGQNVSERQNVSEEMGIADTADGSGDSGEWYMLRLVKAADKISALIKCIEERNAGNLEFRSAEESTQNAVNAMAKDLPEVKDFLEDFLPAYGKTLDELTGTSC